MAAESQRARERRELEERVSYFLHIVSDPPWFPLDPDRYLNAGGIFKPWHNITPKTVCFTFLFFFYQRLFFSVLENQSFKKVPTKIISWLQLVESVRGYSARKQNNLPHKSRTFKLGCVPHHFNADLDPDPTFHINDPDPVVDHPGLHFWASTTLHSPSLSP